MTQDRVTPQGNGEKGAPRQKVVATSYYGLLGLHPSASVREIRQAYRDLSKLYHPDTTLLTTAIATAKFQLLNEAYATLSSPERRTAYDRKIGYGYSNAPIIRPSSPPSQANGSTRIPPSSSAYLDPTDRPLSPGEIFALFILGLTFVGCLILAIAIGITRGEAILQPNIAATSEPRQEIITVETDSINQPTPATVTQVPMAPATQVPMDQSSFPAAPVADPISLPSGSIPPVSLRQGSLTLFLPLNT